MLDFTPKTLHYPALVYKHLDTKSSDRVTCMFEREATPENHPGVPRIHVDPISIEDSANVLHGLMDALTGELHRLRAFHRPGGDVHYHQTLGSVLARAIRIVYAMRSLLPHQIEQALVWFVRCIDAAIRETEQLL